LIQIIAERAGSRHAGGMLGQLRATVNPLKKLLAAPLARAGIAPLTVTLAALPLSLASAALLLGGRPLAAAAVACAASLTDFLDGAVARAQGRTSAAGNYLEAMVDRVVEIILLLALGWFFPWPAAFALATSMLVSYAKPRVALVIPTDNRDWPGLGDHCDRLLLIVLAMASCAVSVTVPAALLWVLSGVASIGAWQRIRYALELVAEAEREQRVLPGV